MSVIESDTRYPGLPTPSTREEHERRQAIAALTQEIGAEVPNVDAATLFYVVGKAFLTGASVALDQAQKRVKREMSPWAM